MTQTPAAVLGDAFGVAFPPTLEPLLEMGPDFLTEAFHASGALAADNAVIAIDSAREFFGGGMGRKLELDIRYAKPSPDLHRELFVKTPLLFGDPLRDAFAPVMQPEVRFAIISRQAGFPVRTPKCYFADYDAATQTGILITERIPYGSDDIEARHEKCADYELKNPLAYYRAMTTAMARLAGAHKAGGLGEIDDLFPFDRDAIEPGSRIPFDATELDRKIETLAQFAIDAPQFFPQDLGERTFLESFSKGARAVLKNERVIRRRLNAAEDYVALCHWNMNLDNAWFQRDVADDLEVGLLDWGGVSQMNACQSFFGMTCAAEIDFLNDHREDLVALFVREYRASGGPNLDPAVFLDFYRLSVALLGVAWMLDAPLVIARELPSYKTLENRFDPVFRENFLARAQMQILVVLLNEWRALDIGETVFSV